MQQIKVVEAQKVSAQLRKLRRCSTVYVHLHKFLQGKESINDPDTVARQVLLVEK